MAEHPQIKLIEKNAQWIKSEQNETTISLKYDVYRDEVEKDKEKSDFFKRIAEYDSKLTFKSLKYEQSLFTQDSVLREKRDRWHKNLAKDVYVEEAINVLQDLQMNNIKKANSKLASVKG